MPADGKNTSRLIHVESNVPKTLAMDEIQELVNGRSIEFGNGLYECRQYRGAVAILIDGSHRMQYWSKRPARGVHEIGAVNLHGKAHFFEDIFDCFLGDPHRRPPF